MNRLLSIAGILLFASSIASATVDVGDKPKLQFKPFGSQNNSLKLEDYKGKIVVVDFWATWCGPCMAEADHMVAMYEQYHPKGLEFIGISLDQDGAKMTDVAKQKKFTWPQYFDGKVWKNDLAVEWGVNSIPRTFLIGPAGDVLWTGHPAQIDKPLADAFKNHPPQLVDPKVMSDATAALDTADASAKSGAFAEAFKSLSKFPPAAKKDPKLADRFTETQKTLEAAAEQILAEVDPLIAAGNFAEASTRLHALADSLDGTPSGTKAKQKLADLQRNPKAKEAIEAADKTKKADEALAVAKNLASEKKDEAAYIAFKSVVKTYPRTDAAKAASEAVATYEKDPNFVKRANEKEFGGKARSLLSLASNYRTAGKMDLAKKKYQEVIDQFPGTTYADTAKKEMGSMK